MNQIKHFLFLVSAIIICTTPAGASTIFNYTYTGNQFDNPAGIYNPQDHISIEFSIDESLIPRNSRFSVSTYWDDSYYPFRMKISDGKVHINSDEGSRYGHYLTMIISFATDANGDVDGSWNISAWLDFTVGGGRYEPIGTLDYNYKSAFNDPISPDADSSYFAWNYEPYIDYFTGEPIPRNSGNRTVAVLNNPGVWTRTAVTVVPLPGGMLMFISAFGYIWFNRRTMRNLGSDALASEG